MYSFTINICHSKCSRRSYFLHVQMHLSQEEASQAGVITKPNSVAAVGTIKASSGGSAITSHSANTTGSNRTVTLFFDLTVPPGYTNAGSTVECSKDFEQACSKSRVHMLDCKPIWTKNLTVWNCGLRISSSRINHSTHIIKLWFQQWEICRGFN